MDEYKDRGVKKWTAMMLPEHVEMVKEVFAEDKKKEKPILDEQQLWENEAVLQSALKNDFPIHIKYFKDNNFHEIQGHVLFIDSLNGILRLENEEIRLTDVIEVRENVI